MKVFTSNKLEILADQLCDLLFAQGDPFAKRVVVVPDSSVKNFLFHRFAKKLQVAAGFQVITLSQALRLFFPEIPSSMHLSLKIEKAIGEEPLLHDYLAAGGAHRTGAFCDELGRLFLHYATYGHNELEAWKKRGGWQPSLWKRVWKEGGAAAGYPVMLFHCGFMPRLYLDFFAEAGAPLFALSPSAMYWGDFLSEKKQARVLEKTTGGARDEWKRHFQEQNPLLANCGTVVQRFFSGLEDVEETYEVPEGESLLHRLQQELLTLEVLDKEGDDSIQIHTAPSFLREVEVVWELTRGCVGSIAVYAPDISLYAPYIQMVFTKGEYTLVAQQSKLATFLQALLQLPASDFSVKPVLRLLSPDEMFQKWVERGNIYVGWNEGPSSWEAGFNRLIDELVFGSSIEFSEAELLGRWIDKVTKIRELLIPIESGEKQSIAAWTSHILHIIDALCVVGPEDESVVQEIRGLGKIDIEDVPFSTFERALTQIFSKQTSVIQENNLQAIRFSSLQTALPADCVILMGMQESAFPRKAKRTSLQEIEGEFCPSPTQEDRALFLEQILSARKQLLFTYCRTNPDDGKQEMASPVLEELLRYVPSIHVEHHPLLSPRVSFAPQSPIISLPDKLPLPQIESCQIDIRQLQKLARHPFAFYFERKEGILFEREWQENREFALSPLDYSIFRTDSLHKDIETILAEAEKSGKLPVGKWRDVATMAIRREIAEYRQTLATLRVQSTFSVELSPSCTEPLQIENRWIVPAVRVALEEGKEISIVGKIDGASERGLLVHIDEKERARALPLSLLLPHIPLDIPRALLLTKEGKEQTFSHSPDSLARYLRYFFLASQEISPFYPKWMNSLARGIEAPSSDPVITWMQRRGAFPDPVAWSALWEPVRKEVFDAIL